MNKETYSLFDGVILGENSYLFIGVEDARANEPNSHGIIWKFKNDEWNSVEINETLISCTLTENDDYYFVAIAETGKEFVIGDSGVYQNVIATGAHSPVRNGPLTNVSCVTGNEIYAVGTARQVYKKTKPNKWIRQDHTCKPEHTKERANAAFLMIDGFSDNDIYAVGWDGQIWHFDGQTWMSLVSPTNMILFSVCCCSNGMVYVSGQNGIVLRGRDSMWEIIEQSVTTEALRDVEEFAGNVYVCSNHFLYMIQGDEFTHVTADYQVKSFGKLKSFSQGLLSVGLKDAAVFDGDGWRQIF